MSGAKIPHVFHFVFGLREQTEPFHLAHYLCLESCRRVNRPDAIRFHFHNEPHGPWWDRIRPHLDLQPIGRESFVSDSPLYALSDEGRFIRSAALSYAHEADFIRLKILLREGGVYADIDTLFVNPLPAELFTHEFVMGEEDPTPDAGGLLRPSLCNALMLSAPAARFGRRWLERMYWAFDGSWSRHSCQEAVNVWREHPQWLHVVPRHFFFKHGFSAAGIRSLLEELDADFDEVYSMHLWAHLWWSADRTDFSQFHADRLTESYVRSAASTYSVVARRFLD